MSKTAGNGMTTVSFRETDVRGRSRGRGLKLKRKEGSEVRKLTEHETRSKTHNNITKEVAEDKRGQHDL